EPDLQSTITEQHNRVPNDLHNQVLDYEVASSVPLATCANIASAITSWPLAFSACAALMTSRLSLFWLSFDLPMRRVIAISSPTIDASISSMNVWELSAIRHGCG